MYGNFEFRLDSRFAVYRFMVKRKITRITGESATGKSELCRLIIAGRNPRARITVTCKYPARVFDDSQFFPINASIQKINAKFKNHNNSDYKAACRDALAVYDNNLFFVDESVECLNTHEFSVFCKYTDSFFVIISRAPLTHLPYSFTEIYKMKTSGRSHTLIQVHEAGDFSILDDRMQIVTEDSNSGFQFIKNFNKAAITAKGKSNLLKVIDENQCILADGAAFGSEIELILNLIRSIICVLYFSCRKVLNFYYYRR